MWPHMGWMGWWMAFWWVLGLAVLVFVVWVVVRAVGGSPTRADESPEQVLKRRYARGEIDRDEYQRRLEDIRR